MPGRVIPLSVKTILISTFFSAVLLISCQEQKKPVNTNIQEIAAEYIKLAFNVGKFDKDYVDAYFGPDSLKEIALKQDFSLLDLQSRVAELQIRLQKTDINSLDSMSKLRFRFLDKQLEAMKTRVDFLAGVKISFDDEVSSIYDAVLPIYPVSHYLEIIDSLNSILPGTGSVADKFNKFRDQFIIPPAKVDTVFKAAIAECRKRTKQYINLPDYENFTVSYVKDKPWGAYNWFKGHGFSLIEVNTDLPIYIDRAIDLACHEGYPGHHVYHTLIEKYLYKDRNWIEFSIYPLFSPQSFISEGTANFGIDLAFPGEERVKFEREVLFPLAGINPGNAELYYKALELVKKLSYAGNEAARRYLDGKLSKKEAVKWLINYELRSPERAEKYLSFIEQYRAYVINYNLGEDLVKKYIDRKADNNKPKRWEEFKKLIERPVLPSDLR